jgi:dihydrolipoamide dehydrogenase
MNDGTKVTIIEMLDHLLPNEDLDCSLVLERSFAKRGMTVLVKTKTDKLEKMPDLVDRLYKRLG